MNPSLNKFQHHHKNDYLDGIFNGEILINVFFCLDYASWT